MSGWKESASGDWRTKIAGPKETGAGKTADEHRYVQYSYQRENGVYPVTPLHELALASNKPLKRAHKNIYG